MTADVSEVLALAAGLDREQKQLPGKIVGAVTAAAKIGETVAKAWAPVGATGDLRASISTSIRGSGGTAGASALIRCTVPYGWYNEAGTARQAPTPFMQPGRDAAEPVLVAGLEKIANGIEL